MKKTKARSGIWFCDYWSRTWWSGSWGNIIDFAETYNHQLVCKPNDGTGGKDVFVVKNQLELEQAVHQLLEAYRSICLSPFYEIEQEYRVIVLAGQCACSQVCHCCGCHSKCFEQLHYLYDFTPSDFHLCPKVQTVYFHIDSDVLHVLEDSMNDVLKSGMKAP